MAVDENSAHKTAYREQEFWRSSVIDNWGGNKDQGQRGFFLSSQCEITPWMEILMEKSFFHG